MDHQFNILMNGAHTHTECVPLAPARTQCFGRDSANLDKPILISVEPRTPTGCTYSLTKKEIKSATDKLAENL